jgi:GNAT superfamily N-acetyltransferase
MFGPGKAQALGYAAMDIRARPATEADKAVLRWLEEACMREYAVALWGAWRPRPPDEQMLDGCRIIEGGESVGCVTTIARPDHVWVDQLYISPRFQRKGIGSTVLAHDPLGSGGDGGSRQAERYRDEPCDRLLPVARVPHS